MKSISSQTVNYNSILPTPLYIRVMPTVLEVVNIEDVIFPFRCECEVIFFHSEFFPRRWTRDDGVGFPGRCHLAFLDWIIIRQGQTLSYIIIQGQGADIIIRLYKDNEHLS